MIEQCISVFGIMIIEKEFGFTFLKLYLNMHPVALNSHLASRRQV